QIWSNDAQCHGPANYCFSLSRRAERLSRKRSEYEGALTRLGNVEKHARGILQTPTTWGPEPIALRTAHLTSPRKRNYGTRNRPGTAVLHFVPDSEQTGKGRGARADRVPRGLNLGEPNPPGTD